MVFIRDIKWCVWINLNDQWIFSLGLPNSPVGGVCADGRGEEAVDDDVGVAADGGGEVGVDGAGQAVVREQWLLDAAGREVHRLHEKLASW